MSSFAHAGSSVSKDLHSRALTSVFDRVQDFEPPSGELASAISAEFGSLDDLIAKFNAAAVGVQVGPM